MMDNREQGAGLVERLRALAEVELRGARIAIEALPEESLREVVVELAGVSAMAVAGAGRETLEEVAANLVARDAVQRVLADLADDDESGAR